MQKTINDMFEQNDKIFQEKLNNYTYKND